MQRIGEIYETESFSETNEYLQKGWVLLLVCNTQKGPLYVLGRRDKPKNVANR